MKYTITAGHSNTDPGACANGFKEAELAAELRNIVALKLRELGHTVVTDGTGASNQTLPVAISLIKGSDLAVEMHFNAATPTAKGVEVIALDDKKELCQQLSTAIANVLQTSIRGHRGGYKHPSETPHKKLGYCTAGGLIIETCFISNPGEMAIYQAKKWLVASAIAKTLDDWSKR